MFKGCARAQRWHAAPVATRSAVFDRAPWWPPPQTHGHGLHDPRQSCDPTESRQGYMGAVLHVHACVTQLMHHEKLYSFSSRSISYMSRSSLAITACELLKPLKLSLEHVRTGQYQGGGHDRIGSSMQSKAHRVSPRSRAKIRYSRESTGQSLDVARRGSRCMSSWMGHANMRPAREHIAVRNIEKGDLTSSDIIR